MANTADVVKPRDISRTIFLRPVALTLCPGYTPNFKIDRAAKPHASDVTDTDDQALETVKAYNLLNLYRVRLYDIMPSQAA